MRRARWRSAPVSKETIRDVLAKGQDRRWVLWEAMTRVAQDLLSQRLLLHYGLEESQRLLTPAPTSSTLSPTLPEGEDGWWLWAARLRLLQQRDRLGDLGAIWDKGEDG